MLGNIKGSLDIDIIIWCVLDVYYMEMERWLLARDNNIHFKWITISPNSSTPPQQPILVDFFKL